MYTYAGRCRCSGCTLVAIIGPSSARVLPTTSGRRGRPSPRQTRHDIVLGHERARALDLQKGPNHVGHEAPGGLDVDRNGRSHARLAQLLSAAQQLEVDLADLLEDCSHAAVVLEPANDLVVICGGDILHQGPFAGAAHREVELGSVPRSIGTPAPRLPTALVALDERTPDHRMERRQLSQERQPSLTQNPGRIPAPTLRTSHLRGLISYRACFVNVFVTTLDAFEQLGERPQLVEAHDQARRALEMGVGRGLRPVRPLFRDGERAAGTTSKDQALNAGETPTLKHSKALPAQWMEEMRNLGPSPLLAGLRCSGQWASECPGVAWTRRASGSTPV